jgi:hypothetical protein
MSDAFFGFDCVASSKDSTPHAIVTIVFALVEEEGEVSLVSLRQSKQQSGSVERHLTLTISNVHIVLLDHEPRMV